jgi:hypothetical protein
LIYPAMTSDQAEKIWANEQGEADPGLQKGTGALLDTSTIDRVVVELDDFRSLFSDLSQSRSERRWDEFEAGAARIIHRGFASIDRHVLADMEFWIWLATARLASIIDWRYSGASGRAAPANYGIKSRRENFIYRLWLQGTIGFDPEANEYDLVDVANRDLWRSHIFRQNYANSRCLARALLRLQSGRLENAAPLDKYALREMAKLLRRLGSNVFFVTLSDPEADRLILELLEEAHQLGDAKRQSDAERRVQRRVGGDH